MNLSLESVNTTGRIFNFQRYAIHDGPGIRSVLFLSGCPLRCRWCCNPESYIEDPKIHRKINVAEVMQWLREDKPYFKNSGGGVTLSGGEPLLQIDFIKAFLSVCRNEDIGTAIETCGEVPWENFTAISGLVDYYLYDIKQTVANLHEDGTGVNNKRIIDNLRKLSLKSEKICFRIPLIPGFNATDRFSFEIGELAKEIKPYQIHILPYHKLGKEKYLKFGISYQDIKEENNISDSAWNESVANFLKNISSCHSDILVGG
jgi:pyruvate formate lyase activating enzyme